MKYRPDTIINWLPQPNNQKELAEMNSAVLFSIVYISVRHIREFNALSEDQLEKMINNVSNDVKFKMIDLLAAEIEKIKARAN